MSLFYHPFTHYAGFYIIHIQKEEEKRIYITSFC